MTALRVRSRLGVALLVLAATLPGQDRIPVGGRVESVPLREVVLNDEGHRDLRDYRGRPVLIEWWGTR